MDKNKVKLNDKPLWVTSTELDYRQKFGLVSPNASLIPMINLTSPLAENRDEDVLNDLREQSFFRK